MVFFWVLFFFKIQTPKVHLTELRVSLKGQSTQIRKGIFSHLQRLVLSHADSLGFICFEASVSEISASTKVQWTRMECLWCLKHQKTTTLKDKAGITLLFFFLLWFFLLSANLIEKNDSTNNVTCAAKACYSSFLCVIYLRCAASNCFSKMKLFFLSMPRF